jgi:ankyrin repeat protein
MWEIAVLEGVPHGRLDVKDRWGRTAIMWAVYGNHLAAVSALIAAGSAFNAVHEKGRARSVSQCCNIYSNI